MKKWSHLSCSGWLACWNRARRKTGVGILMALLLFLIPRWTEAQSSCQEGVQASGSVYRICMPEATPYNGSLVVWAHGFQDAGTPVQIPDDQLSFNGFSIPDTVTQLGFAFATNSYSKTGLAVLQGMDDIVDLVALFSAEQGAPQKTFLVGASEGGLITALLLEQRPDLFDAGLAVCGPVGDFQQQIKYFGHARASFEYFFPGTIPGDPFDPPDILVQYWREYYEYYLMPYLFNPENRPLLDQWVRVARLPFDENDYLATVEQSVRDVLRYAVVNLRDASATLGGFPFDNTTTRYSGSDDDDLLNASIIRVAADPAAVSEMQTNYNTSGVLSNPLITMHTKRDQQVPFWHETVYNLKSWYGGSFIARHINIPIDRYGHCNFMPEEALRSFAIMLLYAGSLDLLLGP